MKNQNEVLSNETIALPTRSATYRVHLRRPSSFEAVVILNASSKEEARRAAFEIENKDLEWDFDYADDDYREAGDVELLSSAECYKLGVQPARCPMLRWHKDIRRNNHTELGECSFVTLVCVSCGEATGFACPTCVERGQLHVEHDCAPPIDYSDRHKENGW
jgi:hypothetical protein